MRALPEPSEQRRRRIAAMILAAVFAVFAARLVLVQIVQGPSLAAAALDGRMRTYEIEAPRGDILDAHGEVLATSGERVHVGANLKEVAQFKHVVDGEVVGTGAAEAAKLLAPVLGRDAAELGGELMGTRSWVYLAKDLEPAKWREIRELGIRGIEPEWIADRVYPNGTTAGNIVGFVGKDNFGLAGLEQTYDEALQGVPGSETVEIGGGGQVIPTGVHEIVEPQPGATIYSTINRDLQFLAQEQVDWVVSTYGAEWAAVAVMEVGTGNLLVLADSGAVDPNNPGDWAAEDRGARSTSAPYEPGSTGKLMTVATSLNEGTINTGTVFNVRASETFDGQTFSDHVYHEPIDMTTTGILATSSNVGTVKIGNLVGDQTRFDYMLEFGFGKTTDLGLPGESAGILPPPPWDGRTRMTNMFGQGFAITLVQNVAMVGTIANDGVYVAPRLVSQIEYADGTIEVPVRAESREVLRPESARAMIDMMESVTASGGTGVLANIDGYRVAGKTGTAQTAGSTGQLTEAVANFVGIVPADDPKFAIAVVAYKPKYAYYGGIIAAPVFRNVASDALDYYGVAPSQGSSPALPWAADGSTTLRF